MGSNDPPDKDSFEIEVNLTASQEIPVKRGRRVRKQTDLLSPDEIASIKRADSITMEEMPSFDSSLDYELDSPRPTHELEEAPAPPEVEVPQPESAMAPTERELPRFVPEDPTTRQPTVTMAQPRSSKNVLMPVLVALVCMLGLIGGVGLGLFLFIESEPRPNVTDEAKAPPSDQIDPAPTKPQVPTHNADAGTDPTPNPRPGRGRPAIPTKDDDSKGDEESPKDTPKYRMVD